MKAITLLLLLVAAACGRDMGDRVLTAARDNGTVLDDFELRPQAGYPLAQLGVEGRKSIRCASASAAEPVEICLWEYAAARDCFAAAGADGAAIRDAAGASVRFEVLDKWLVFVNAADSTKRDQLMDSILML